MSRDPSWRPFEPQPWADQAICAGIGGDEFFPEKNLNGGRAKRICMNCPVRLPCLQYALDNHEWGIWGGTSDMERRRIRNQGEDVA